MREYWINYYPSAKGIWRMGAFLPSATDANLSLRNVREDQPERGATAFRIHVRLKPEGAPKRYASEANRRAWERDPETCRMMVRHGSKPEEPWDD